MTRVGLLLARKYPPICTASAPPPQDQELYADLTLCAPLASLTWRTDSLLGGDSPAAFGRRQSYAQPWSAGTAWSWVHLSPHGFHIVSMALVCLHHVHRLWKVRVVLASWSCRAQRTARWHDGARGVRAVVVAARRGRAVWASDHGGLVDERQGENPGSRGALGDGPGHGGSTSSTATTRGSSRPSCARGTRTRCGRSTRR